MKYLVVYNENFMEGKEFDDVNKAVDYIFEQVGKTGASKDDFRIYQGIEVSCNANKKKEENKKEESVKGAEPSGTIHGVQMSIFDFLESAEDKDEEEDKTIKSIELNFNNKVINEALNKLLAIINEYNIDSDLDGGELTLDLASLLVNNIEVNIETDK